ncbi:predicted protein [Thalassiosira pseudonana CCMP1335]|uniref:Uncharacterized protein n=1 Tax=Thalassiosira pseudonana TaxID=35128 RepID=B5YP46_THAPS|nr:predicted protein [Thalassiosira pseudonana CCMP1335]ACI64392.1 predicted protein [Thalassiosira pseudonana CCMP1335]
MNAMATATPVRSNSDSGLDSVASVELSVEHENININEDLDDLLNFAASEDGSIAPPPAVVNNVSPANSISPNQQQHQARRHVKVLKKIRKSAPASVSPIPAAASAQTRSSHTAILYDPTDEGNINDAHNIIRRDVWKISIATVKHRFAKEGTIVLGCRFCEHIPEGERVHQSEVAPESIAGIYRSYLRFNSKHFSKCPEIPDELRAKHERLRNGKGTGGRGTKKYWETSALMKGMRDASDRKGIVFCEEATY